MIPGVHSHRKLNGGAPPEWKITSPSLSRDVCSEKNAIDVVAIISTWFDADIIYANVRNCFLQGCSRVLLLDNDSPDESVKIAVSAGAEVAEVYSTEFYDDDLRIYRENEIARNVVKASSGKPTWILSLDADEFIHGHNGMTVAETLSLIPRSIRTVGSHAFDLYPTRKNPYVIGDHPAKHFESGCLRIGTFCEKNHWKHAAIQYEEVFDIAQTRGNHSPAVPNKSVKLLEPESLSLPILHAPFRRYEDSKRRLQALCGKNNLLQGKSRAYGDDQVTGNMGATKRWQSLEDVYAGRWDKVEIPHCKMLYGRQVTGVSLYPWRDRFKGIQL